MTYTPPPSFDSISAHNKLATLLEVTYHGNAKDTADNNALFRGAMWSGPFQCALCWRCIERARILFFSVATQIAHRSGGGAPGLLTQVSEFSLPI